MLDDKEESLISHLEALRYTLIKCIVSVVIFIPFCLYFSPKALDFLLNILIGKNKILFNYFSPTEVFIIEIKLALLMSFIIAFPYVIKQIWNFIVPALYDNERKFLKTIVFLSSFLFITGVIFCIFVILPLVINFGINFSSKNIQAMFGISNIANLSMGLSFVFGLMFQIPLIVYSLIKYNIVAYDFFADKRPYIVVLLLIFSAILTPPDVVSQLMLFTPTYLLFELGLIFSKFIKK